MAAAAAGFRQSSIAIEEVARADAAASVTLAAHLGLGVETIARFGSEEQKQRYIPSLASGKGIAAWALTEPGSGFRRRRDGYHRRAAQRRLGAERFQAVHYQRRGCGDAGGVRQPGPRPGLPGRVRLYCAGGHAGDADQPAAQQDGHPRFQHVRGGL